MLLANAPMSGQVHALVDWIEFNVLISEYKIYRLVNVIRLADEEQEEENSNIAEQDASNESVLESVMQEIAIRLEALDSAYPFKLNDDESELVFSGLDSITKGGYVYLYCLFFSHVLREDVLFEDPPHSNADRDLMQLCSTYAAAGVVHGNAVSFGFPRPDNTNFLNALKKTYDDFGEGKVHDNVPPGAPVDEKDARVDVIAWENTLDGLPGGRYLLGQAASGKKWDDKSIRGEIDPFHDIWFIQKPPSTPTPAMFIPFCIDIPKGSKLEDAVAVKTYKHGDLYYRYRLPRHAENGLLLAENDANNDYRIDRTNEFPKIEKYVVDFLGVLN